ncbi:MAG TPA: tannase/feruloyl esterase family alpha/beta hydrolase [Novosphingobium sp.]|nr:tannase/feruloyl esterase family alpha/beta hydrolase [Novosphingobium sp.]
MAHHPHTPNARKPLLSRPLLLAAPLLAAPLAVALAVQPARSQAPAPANANAACAASLPVAWPQSGTRIERATLMAPSTVAGANGRQWAIPAHCEIFGIMHEHKGVDGQDYAIRFHLRLPTAWNGRFFFQGGGGSNGEIGDALGRVASGPSSLAFEPAVARGFAVVSQDSGHSNALNSDPKRGGPTAFGFDPVARSDYGHASLAPVTRAARAIVAAYYGHAPKRSYFVGCSKGGEEGMVLAQQHPDLFDGIVAAAPGFALPRAAVEQTWEVQRLARLIRDPATGRVDVNQFHTALTPADMGLVRDAVLRACDSLDGAKDGIVSNAAACTSARVKPAIEARVCKPGGHDCLTRAKADALYELMAGARWADGAKVYADWAWDPGLASPGWRGWKLGDERGPARHIVLGGASMHTVFLVPPRAVPGDAQGLLDAQLAFDVAREGRQIYATGHGFTLSPWQDVSAHSTDLSAFAARGGRLIVPHGLADPVFSFRDTAGWWAALNARNHGHAADFARVFAVPGMNHCGGGDATDQYDALAAVQAWVEQGRAPDAIPAQANPQSAWPDRRRPLCAWPSYARYKGHGSLDDAANFACVKPRG